MVNQDIRKIDNWLIRIGFTALVFALILFLGYIGNSKQATWEQMIPGAFFLVAGLGFFITGLIYRRWEKKVVSLWSILDHAREISLNDLQSNGNYDLAFIEKAIPVINEQPGAYYVLDRGEKKIFEGRLRASYAIDEKCPNCGNSVKSVISLSDTAVACSYCNSALPAEFLNRVKSQVLSGLYTNKEISEKTQATKNFQVSVFILLLFFFWPAAIYYLIRRGGIQNPSS